MQPFPIRIICSRIPFLPNRDLIFLSASLEIAKHVEVSEAGIAGIMLTVNILNKVMNLIFFSAFSLKKDTEKEIE